MSGAQPEQLYEADFYAWTREQAKELRRLARIRPKPPLDLVHIAEEIQDLGKSEDEAVFSSTQRIIEHLLLIEHSPAADQRLRWADEIDEFGDRIDRKLSPRIRRRLKRDFDEAFGRARRRVRRRMDRYGETHAITTLPAQCPYTLEQGARRLAARGLTLAHGRKRCFA
jgi:hypothetical protein